MFNFEGNSVLIDIRASMAPKDRPKFKLLVFVDMCVIVFLVTLTGAINYYAYGSTVEDIVTLNLPFEGLASFA